MVSDICMFILNPILENRHFITDITDITEYYGISYYGILRNITVRNISPALIVVELKDATTCLFAFLIYLFKG